VATPINGAPAERAALVALVADADTAMAGRYSGWQFLVFRN
jgi:hypothetical protein